MEKCIICGCIKDGAEYIENIFKNIEKIQSLFNETKIIIAYDISKDNTLEILEKLQKKFDLTILINKNPLSNVRTINIENARNSILNVIYKILFKAFMPVCGDNGVTYSSACHLQRDSCEKQKTITIQDQAAHLWRYQAPVQSKS